METAQVSPRCKSERRRIRKSEPLLKPSLTSSSEGLRARKTCSQSRTIVALSSMPKATKKSDALKLLAVTCLPLMTMKLIGRQQRSKSRIWRMRRLTISSWLTIWHKDTTTKRPRWRARTTKLPLLIALSSLISKLEVWPTREASSPHVKAKMRGLSATWISMMSNLRLRTSQPCEASWINKKWVEEFEGRFMGIRIISNTLTCLVKRRKAQGLKKNSLNGFEVE